MGTLWDAKLFYIDLGVDTWVFTYLKIHQGVLQITAPNTHYWMFNFNKKVSLKKAFRK